MGLRKSRGEVPGKVSELETFMIVYCGCSCGSPQGLG